MHVNINASPKSKYWWTENGIRLRKSKKYRPKRFRYLRVKDVEKSDAGDYMFAGQAMITIKYKKKITLNVVGKN